MHTSAFGHLSHFNLTLIFMVLYFISDIKGINTY